MTTLQISSSLFRSFLLVICVFVIPSLSSDSDPLQDFCVGDLKASPSINGFPCKSSVSASDFFFSGLGGPLNTSTPNGVAVSPANVLTFPGLNTLGLSMNNVEFAPGGVNPPHSHPRATEAGVVIEGSVFVGFLTTNNTLFSKVLNAGEMFVVPRGLVHFQWNVGKVKARLITSFNSQLPGSAVLPSTLFGSNPTIPNAVLTKTFRTDDVTVNKLKSKFAV
ncbi:F14D16.13 [Arabidopsis thaliana]|uniref:Germin-like protein subfamily T member 2 n=5 Tax=Arabidopsis TaxID=3701 RepID=GLT2_ARATH|nr:RmlC-like cupins superfamily protein [Arabidopsis thaliana]Q9LMC9.1 RecName: Full=Germin-like protein subfamily T member 2; Flags: Precursor [Arabidopsis thaliana]KAG7646824.1 Cupin 1 [Arabidopsis thaliana x Arabidopsis arenosa]KAG7654802.1 Cupin 1 [Arabidopsis suecica]AAF79303.1 F14D16.13 [Arabidopsis thaliana]AAM61433.1 germin, putative [Arabidopsis thaliana]ABD60724.1 At1g18980 [Arabidopsis thaliana]|eukprot:NP_173332.1 RmlC-like cupins superfamily protein [Arabidopsis thaliana]